MTTITAPADRSGLWLGAPKLRLRSSGEGPSFAGRAPSAPRRARGDDGAWRNHATDARANAAVALAPEHASLAPSSDAPVLVAARDATHRAAIVDELTQTMPPDTKFAHASAFWEVLVLAGASRMVIVSGELDEISTGSLMRVLGHRYPALPVVALEAPSALAHA